MKLICDSLSFSESTFEFSDFIRQIGLEQCTRCGDNGNFGICDDCGEIKCACDRGFKCALCSKTASCTSCNNSDKSPIRDCAGKIDGRDCLFYRKDICDDCRVASYKSCERIECKSCEDIVLDKKAEEKQSETKRRLEELEAKQTEMIEQLRGELKEMKMYTSAWIKDGN